MPLWTDAYLADTGHLSYEEHGYYLMILLHMWRAPGRRFPNDDEWLRRKFRLCEADSDKLLKLLDEFCQCDGNWWTQKKLNKVWRDVERTHQKQCDRAKSRWNNEKDLCRGNAAPAVQPKPKHLDSESHTYRQSPESESSESDTNTVPSAKPKTQRRHEYPEAFQQFWLAYPKRSTDTKAGAFKAWDKARKAGTDLGALYEGALRYAAYVDLTGCEKAHVQTWINREGWTASYANGDGHARPTTQRPSAIQDFWGRHGRAAGSASGSSDPPDASDPSPD